MKISNSNKIAEVLLPLLFTFIFSSNLYSQFEIQTIPDANVNENAVYTSESPQIINGTPMGTVTWSLGAADPLFTINSETGVVSLAAQNFEDPQDETRDNIFNVEIVAIDEDLYTTSTSWTVTVINQNETVAFDIQTISNADVNENTPYTSLTPQINGTPNGIVTWSLGASADPELTINSETGEVSLVAQNFEVPADENTDNVFNVELIATDADENTASITWTITVINQNETVTFSIETIDAVNVTENEAYTSVTPQINGMPNGIVAWSLGISADPQLTIDSQTGVVSLDAQNFEAPADANTDNIFNVELIATDADENTASTTWTVRIIDQIETVSFGIQSISNANVNENEAYSSGTPLIINETPIGTVTWSLGASADPQLSIDSETGEVSLAAQNFEAPADANTDNLFNVELIATDADGNSASTTWTVRIIDQIETVAFAIETINAANVNENTPYTSVTPTITNGIPIGTVTWSLGATADPLLTINSATGVVSLIAQNFETPADVNPDNIFNAAIIATDQDGNTATISWTITILDVNEIVSFTISPISNLSIDENQPYTSITPALTGDTPIGAITWSLNGNDATHFLINATSGVVNMIAQSFEEPQDWDTGNTYEVVLIATDADNNTATINWTVTINDVIETANFSITPIPSISIDENTAYTSVLPQLTGNTPIGAITYSLSGADMIQFTITPSTGQVTMLAKDFESPQDINGDNIYEVSITATDEDGNNTSMPWTVTVNNVQETSTFSLNTIANASVNENSIYTSEVPAITGTPIGSLSYTLEGVDATLFTINETNGVVSMIARNFEAPADTDLNNVYQITITATDEDLNNTSTSWTVTVNDVIETSIFTIGLINDAIVNENNAYLSVTPVISGIAIGTVSYTLGGTDATSFTIDESTGIVSMVARNFENPADVNTDNIYEVSITATDSDANTATESWTVTITDVIEAASFTISTIEDLLHNENTAYTGITPVISGTPIGSLTYTLTGSDALSFSITATSGVISMVARNFEDPLDVNTDNTYEIGIIATDEDGNTASETWNITITDVLEQAIFTITNLIDVSIGENSAYTSLTPALSGETPIGKVTFSLIGVDATLFTIEASTGIVNMVGRNFENAADANSDNSYEVGITATDEDANTTSISWTVNVTDVLESATYSINTIANALIPENTAYISPTPTISGTPIGTLTYTLGGTDASDFTIDPQTGIVSMVARNFENPEDANADNAYNVSITATDEDNNNNTPPTAWVINVTDVIEAATFTISAIEDVTVSENQIYTSVTPAIIGSTIGTITYTLAGADATLFTLDAETGIVSLTARDYEAPSDANGDNIYELSLIATDEDANNATETWVVTIHNLTESASFTINTIANTSVNENTTYTGVTPTINGSPIGNLQYSLGGTDVSLFTINPSTGVVSMIPRNYELPADSNGDNVYAISITATDEDGNIASMSWQITVTDINEPATFAIETIANANVNENNTYTSATPVITGTPIGTSLVFSLGGADAANFTIDSSTGVIGLTARNFENPQDNNLDNIYEITIIATDEDENQATMSWEVHVIDINEPATFVISTISNVRINENTTYTSVIPTIIGTPIGNQVTFTLTGADAAYFTINPVNGVVTMTARDFESPQDSNQDNIYVVNLTATDVDDNSASTSWLITIDNLQESANFTINTIADLSIGENLVYTSETPVISGPSVGTITWSLSGNDALLFTINPATGVITLPGQNFESPADSNSDNIYQITLRATDQDNNSASIAWTLTVTDVIESSNFSISPIANANIEENSPYSSLPPTITGNPIGNQVSYSISGADASQFTLNATTGVVNMSAQDFEMPADANANNIYEITLTATDADDNTASISWRVIITNVNESSNFAVSPIDNATLSENTFYTSVTPTITGAPVGKVTFSLGGIDGTQFSIDKNTGVVSMVPRNFELPLDNNGDNVYELSITATDHDGNFNIEVWTVTIQDINEPMTVLDIPNQTIDEDQPFTNINLDDYVTDEDHQEAFIEWSFSGNTDIHLAISNRVVTITYPENWNGSETITFTANDGAFTGFDDITLTVTPVNDAPVAMDDTDQSSDGLTIRTLVTENDSDVDGNLDLSTITITRTPQYGEATIDVGTGYIIYIPQDNFYGNDSYEYRICDTNGECDNAFVYLTITTGNAAPTPQPDVVSLNEDGSIDITPLINDTDPNNNLDMMSLSIDEGPENGTIQVNAQNASITYTPYSNFNGEDMIVYKIADNGDPKLTATTTITITVNPVNDAPVAVDDILSVIESNTIEWDVASNDSDVDADVLTATIHASSPALEGLAMFKNNTILEYTAPLNKNCFTEEIIYEICDGNGGCHTATAFITIEPLDTDDDGIPDLMENIGYEYQIDSDSDGIPNSEDLDSDGDGISDAIESGLTDACSDNLRDSDSDGTPDFLDTDSDNDLYPDQEEGTGDCDNDGIPDYVDNDDDCRDEQDSDTQPTIFTPNGDGVNQYFEIPGVSQAEIEAGGTELFVFNRWGGQVFFKKDYDNKWDGKSEASTLGSADLPEGTYFYIFKLKDGKVIKGTVYIKR